MYRGQERLCRSELKVLLPPTVSGRGALQVSSRPCSHDIAPLRGWGLLTVSMSSKGFMGSSSPPKPSRMVPVSGKRGQEHTRRGHQLHRETALFVFISISLGPGDGCSEGKELIDEDLIPSWIHTYKTYVVVRKTYSGHHTVSHTPQVFGW